MRSSTDRQAKQKIGESDCEAHDEEGEVNDSKVGFMDSPLVATIFPASSLRVNVALSLGIYFSDLGGRPVGSRASCSNLNFCPPIEA